MQCPYYVHNALRRALGLSKDQAVVIQAETGGGFGGKEDYPSMIAIHANDIPFVFPDAVLKEAGAAKPLTLAGRGHSPRTRRRVPFLRDHMPDARHTTAPSRLLVGRRAPSVSVDQGRASAASCS